MKTIQPNLLMAITGKTFLWQTAATVMAGLLQSFTTLLLPLSLGIYYELVFHSGSGKGRILQQLGISELSLSEFYLLFLTLLVLKFVFSWKEKYNSQKLSKTLGLNIQGKIFEHYLTGNPGADSTKEADSRIFRFANEPRGIESFYNRVILAGTRDILLLILCFTLLYRNDSTLANYILLCFMLFLSFQFLQAGHFKKSFLLYRKNRSSLFRFAGNALLNKSAIAGLNREAIELKRYQKKQSRLQVSSSPYFLQKSFHQAIFPILMYLCLGGLLWIIASHPTYSTLSAPDLFSYILLVIMLIPALRRIGQLPRFITQAGESWAWLVPILSAPKTIPAKAVRAVADPDLPLYGRSLYEAIAPFKNEKMQGRILQYLNQLDTNEKDNSKLLQQKPARIVKNSSVYQQRCYVLIRALLQPASILVIPDNFWTGISESETKRLKDFIFTTNRLQTDEQRQLN